jgi:hypothetical protein
MVAAATSRGSVWDAPRIPHLCLPSLRQQAGTPAAAQAPNAGSISIQLNTVVRTIDRDRRIILECTSEPSGLNQLTRNPEGTMVTAAPSESVIGHSHKTGEKAGSRFFV